MPVNKNVENSILSLKTQVGTMANGKPRYKSFSYSNVAVDAADEDMYLAAKQLSTLFAQSISKITRQNICELQEAK